MKINHIHIMGRHILLAFAFDALHTTPVCYLNKHGHHHGRRTPVSNVLDVISSHRLLLLRLHFVLSPYHQTAFSNGRKESEECFDIAFMRRSNYFSHSSARQGWLQRYGYLPRTEPGMSVMRSAQTMHSAIAAMQRVYGLNVTGTLDEKTKE